MKKAFRYIEHIWIGKDGKPSLRRLIALAMSVDFIINVHNSASVVIKVLNLISRDKAIDPNLVTSLSGNLAQIVMIIGMEAGLIASLLTLTTYSTVKTEQIKSEPNQENQNLQL